MVMTMATLFRRFELVTMVLVGLHLLPAVSVKWFDFQKGRTNCSELREMDGAGVLAPACFVASWPIMFCI